MATWPLILLNRKLRFRFGLGARSLGLTEKEIFNQIENIKLQNEGDEMKKNSPYAHPIQLILTATSNVF